MQEGARLQLQRGQLNCGVELCLLLVEAYVADKVGVKGRQRCWQQRHRFVAGGVCPLVRKQCYVPTTPPCAPPRPLPQVPASEEAVARVASLVDAFPRGRPGEAADPPVAECSRLVGAAVKWLRRWARGGLEGRMESCGGSAAQTLRAFLLGASTHLPTYLRRNA